MLPAPLHTAEFVMPLKSRHGSVTHFPNSTGIISGKAGGFDEFVVLIEAGGEINVGVVTPASAGVLRVLYSGEDDTTFPPGPYTLNAIGQAMTLAVTGPISDNLAIEVLSVGPLNIEINPKRRIA